MGTATFGVISITNGTTVMASISSATVPITVDVMNPFLLSTTVANTKWISGDTLSISVAQTNLGAKFTSAKLQMDYIPGWWD